MHAVASVCATGLHPPPVVAASMAGQYTLDVQLVVVGCYTGLTRSYAATQPS
jgi:hypothetical protein